jgi:hypothetical protein
MKNELGCYKVNGKTYSNKILAILDAQLTSSEITWNYHKEIYDKVDWMTEPILPLDSLYKLRAQQIREKYDYVVVMCSGGADSTTVLRSFLYNDIHVDEIIAGAPMSGLKGWNWNDLDISVTNTISETKFALFPLLDEVAEKYPKVKISIHDYFNNIIDFKTDEWIYRCQDWVNPAVQSRANLNNFKHLVDLAEQGKSIGILWGIDKPIVRQIENGDMFILISDLAVNNAHPPFDIEYANVDRVLFFWGPDFPEILVKQSHVVARFMHLPENAWMIDSVLKIHRNKNTELSELKTWKQDYQRGIVPVIYPTTYGKVFQCQKVDAAFMPEQHHWINMLHEGSKITQLLHSDFKLFHHNIKDQYLSPDKRSFKRYVQFYKIGHFTKFLPNFDFDNYTLIK